MRGVDKLLAGDTGEAAKVLAALGHQQRLDILKCVLREKLTGPQLIEKLNMGTTGQLYHHLKALLGADLLRQEERGGAYFVPDNRALPVLLLLAAAGDLKETAAYMDMAQARGEAGAYFGTEQGYDPHALLWELLENSVLEHRAGYGSRIDIFLHADGSFTVSDNGRGIPTAALNAGEKPQLQAVLTELGRSDLSEPYWVPGAEKGISVAVVNAMAQRLTVEIRRDGRISRQEYRHGIPQSELQTVGVTSETGMTITVLPDPELFQEAPSAPVIEAKLEAIRAAYPELSVELHLQG
ncbi:ATP-binding protein [Gordoniibacillus kamchatkensis]|uniref:ATP-binding protein n=1 Tax=Gordoniibacillus kamchatkensis TaxID=1590651 RepID=UPI000AD6181C|nr:ATP-binding protein [Paenibacillus sp. VKM B-2647]